MTGHATSKPTCPKCGAEVPPDASRGYCLKCLFALGTEEPEERSQKSETRGQMRLNSAKDLEIYKKAYQLQQ